MQLCSFYKHNKAHGEYRWPLWYDDIVISYQHMLDAKQVNKIIVFFVLII